MPWRIENRDGRYCVIKESDGSSAGCHDSRTDAIKQQRALYANESRVAAMYAELDERTEEYVPPPPMPALEPSALSPLATELVSLLLKDDRERSLTASLAKSQANIADHLMGAQEERQALVAALERIGAPVVNVDVPAPQVNVEVPAPQVTVEPAQITVQAPEVVVAAAPAPNVTVRPEIVLPAQPSKTVTFERDPLTRELTRAEVTEA